MRHSAIRIVNILLISSFMATAALAESGAFMGLDLGWSEPTISNYRAHVKSGGSAHPYFGYMFTDNFGLQGNLHFAVQPPDDDDRDRIGEFPDEEDITGLFGATIGPRFSIPVWDIPSVPFIQGLELYTTAQGGVFSGLGGRLDDTGGGVTVGGGVDFYLTDHLALGAFGRWTTAFIEPPRLPDTFVVQSPGEDNPKDIQFSTVGITLKYDFRARPEPIVCEACVCPECPVAKKIVLRNVHFDFDRSNIRSDGKRILDEAIEIIQSQKGDFTVVLEGHTDSTGPAEYNQKLSERRAEQVKQYLITNGVAEDRIRAVGFGETMPLATNDTREGRQINRRVEPHIDR